MAKHLILVHGRSVKPAGSLMAQIARRALLDGLRRARADAAVADIESGRIEVHFVYYGDINNEIAAAADTAKRAILTASNDPEYTFRPALPFDLIEAGYAFTSALRRFDKPAYRKVLAEAEDWRLLDEAADIASLFGQLFTFGFLNDRLIASSLPDLSAYLTSQIISSSIRGRLQSVLLPRIDARDDMCLLTHSMGCIVAWDVLWKLSYMSEYAAVRERGGRIARWVTFGCPLGEPGVRRNLAGGWARSNEEFPRQVVEWRNIHAEDDYIAHIERMRSAFSTMLRAGFVQEISDRKIYNCWHYADAASGAIVSNPHDLYGYLMHPTLGTAVAEWAAH
ncbi:hypothetical protein VQ042_08510 [Aurantimonas sp. A2-1-M11]|uniref:hypothetical protein n=1 Tax=Aurantimonas sp. A2-1-M11 TaxID=3113712 RepID=UPI002F923354